MIVEFPARQWKWHHAVWIIESNGFAKRLSQDSLENVADTDVVVPFLPAAKQRIFNYNIQNLPFLRATS